MWLKKAKQLINRKDAEAQRKFYKNLTGLIVLKIS